MGKMTRLNNKQIFKSPTRGNDTTTLGAGSVGNTQLQDLSVSGPKIQPASISESHLTSDALNSISKYFKNYIMNAEMAISQRGTSFSSIANQTFMTDRFQYNKQNTSAVHTASQDTDVPTVAQAGYLFQKSLRLNLTTPDTSIGASEMVRITQVIEGQYFAPIAQKAFVMSFWVKATTTGTYCVSFGNVGADRSYVYEYTINSANTWEKKTIPVVASPSGGTWDYAESAGLIVNFILAAGSSLQTTAGAWQTGNFFATSNQVNGVNTGSTDFRITGIMLNEGTVVAPFRTFSNNSYEQELLNCYRYYWRYDATGDTSNNRVALGQNVTTTAASCPIFWPVRMRIAPNVSIGTVGAFALTSANEGLNGCTAITAGERTKDGCYLGVSVGSGTQVAGNATQLIRNSSTAGVIEASAEL